MKKEMFVTAGLCRIKDQIAQSAENPAGQAAEPNTVKADHPVSVFDSLPPETAKALRSRRQEYEHFRQDLNFRLHELASQLARQCEELEKNAGHLQKLKTETARLLDQLQKQSEPDEFSSDFQLRLSSNFRELEHLRIEMIDLQPPSTEKPAENQSGKNIFAELDSVSFGQLFRIGSAMMLPLILAILFSGLLLMLTIFLTFRVNL